MYSHGHGTFKCEIVEPPLVGSRLMQERDDHKRLELANGLTGGVLLRSAQRGALNPEQGQALSQ